jgi:hypothetical protein
MNSLILCDRIAEKLEIARTIGIVTDFVVGPGGPARKPNANVRVRRHANITDEAVRDYLTRLLDGLIADYQIAVTPPVAAETVPIDERRAAAEAVAAAA